MSLIDELLAKKANAGFEFKVEPDEVGGHANRLHSRFGASGAHRWMACPGSVRMCKDIPDRPSAAALEGTQAHELLEAILRCTLSGNDGADVYEAEELMKSAPEGMDVAVMVAVDYVNDLLAEYPDAIILLEQKFEIPVAGAPGEVFGTNDICIYVPSLRLLFIIDYKHGAGKFVEVKGNVQVRFYGLGALAELLNPENPQFRAGWKIDSVALVIIQPRITWAKPVREEWVTVEEILNFGPVIGEAIAAAKDPNAPLTPGEEQCSFCAAKLTCPAYEQKALLAAGDKFSHVQQVDVGALAPSGEMTDEKLAFVLANADAMRAYLRDCESEAERRLRDGRAVPGYKLVEVIGQRRWEKPDAESAAALAEIAERPASDFLALKLRGLGEIETLLKEVPKDLSRKDGAELKKQRLEKMAFLTTKKSSGNLTVVPDSDPRPAANRAGVAFAGVVTIPHVAIEEQQGG